ncbi:DUF222 domain-containing protein [Microbacterium gorillae]|uniref:HNH endonuclease signature motif containing protein n=1 Tax=Microbacterium gorillae TaxID=1231063 RepID=UPI003D979E43
MNIEHNVSVKDPPCETASDPAGPTSHDRGAASQSPGLTPRGGSSPDGPNVEVVRAYVDAIVAVTRSRAATDALEAALLADLVELSGATLGRSSESDLGLRSLAAEVGAAVRVSDRTVQRWMSDAYQLVHDFPAVHAALSQGDISSRHVREILEHGVPIEPGPAREEYVGRALPLARVQSANRLRGMLARVAEEVRDVGITERHREARRARAVWVTDDLDGMSTLHAYLPSVLAHGVKDRLDQMAHALRDADNAKAAAGTGPGTNGSRGAGAGVGAGVGEFRDSRTVDQMRADIFADLLLTNTPHSVDTAIGSIHATVAVTIPVLTLIGTGDDGAELDGAVPIDADTARLLTGGMPGWDRILTHPITGAVLATDRYRPTAEMKRFLTHRDQHCRHPGCRVPIRYTDIDHNEGWAEGGKTDVGNLAPLCRRHHTLKTSAGWKITPHPAGVVEYITPAGYHYIEDPEPRTVTFTIPTESGGGGSHRNSDPGTSSDGEPPW